MAAERTRPDKLSIIVFSGTFERVHYALVTAAASLAADIPATLFFTMGACRALAKPGAEGRPGWHGLPLAEEAGGAAERDHRFRQAGLAGFEDLLSACVALKTTVMVCEMGLKAEGMTLADLRDDIPVAPGGMVTFLADASRDGTVIFV
jgi:peroxiredoxin family protein